MHQPFPHSTPAARRHAVVRAAEALLRRARVPPVHAVRRGAPGGAAGAAHATAPTPWRAARAPNPAAIAPWPRTAGSFGVAPPPSLARLFAATQCARVRPIRAGAAPVRGCGPGRAQGRARGGGRRPRGRHCSARDGEGAAGGRRGQGAAGGGGPPGHAVRRASPLQRARLAARPSWPLLASAAARTSSQRCCACGQCSIPHGALKTNTFQAGQGPGGAQEPQGRAEERRGGRSGAAGARRRPPREIGRGTERGGGDVVAGRRRLAAAAVAAAAGRTW